MYTWESVTSSNDVLGYLEFLAELIDRPEHVRLYPQPGFYGKIRFSPKNPTALLGQDTDPSFGLMGAAERTTVVQKWLEAMRKEFGFRK